MSEGDHLTLNATSAGPGVAAIIKKIESGGQPNKKESVEETAFYYDTITQEIIDTVHINIEGASKGIFSIT